MTDNKKTVESNKVEAQQIPQYIAGFSSHLGALAAGLVLGWTFSCGPNGEQLSKQYDFPISPDEFFWIGSIVTLGAAVVCIPIGVISDKIGRKKSLLITVIPITIGWALIIWASSTYMFYTGRFMTGFSSGVFCSVAPLYTSEISEKAIRGRLGSYYELLLTCGILTSYVLGSIVKDIFWISFMSATVPIIFCCIFTFMPETPIYYLKKGKDDEALRVLIKLRGLDYDSKTELHEHKQYLEFLKTKKNSRFSAFGMKTTIKGVLIIYGLMFIQQMSGTNAIVFYSNNIFTSADVDPDMATIAIGVIMVIAVFISTICVDKVGRKPLLMISSAVMCLSMLILGISFYILENYNIHNVWIPVIAVCTFMFTCEIGLGPIPFVMIGEILDPEIQGVVGSTACCFNWLMAFLITNIFNVLVRNLGNAVTNWLFSAICGIGVIFIYFVVVETKNKSLHEIQMSMNVQWI